MKRAYPISYTLNIHQFKNDPSPLICRDNEDRLKDHQADPMEDQVLDLSNETRKYTKRMYLVPNLSPNLSKQLIFFFLGV